MNKDKLRILEKSDELQLIGMGRAAPYQSLKSEKTRKTRKKIGKTIN